MNLSTGLPALDRILGGDIPAGSTVVLAGQPGTGKTILAQQIAFANASPDRPVRYFTTLSEPHAKLIAHLEPFTFFRRDDLGSSVSFLDLTDLAEADDDEGASLDRAIDAVVDDAFETSPSLVVIDSSRALHHFNGDERQRRRSFFRLASRIAHTGAVLLLVGEYAEEDIDTMPEFAVADGILRLVRTDSGPVERRWLQVLKMRGRKLLAGQHTFEITEHGHAIYPRLESVAPIQAEVARGRAGLGVPELDVATSGGLPTGNASVLMGPAGVGKTLLGCHHIAAGLAAGERCLFVTLEETPAELLEKADGFGLDFSTAYASGQLRILYQPPMTLEIDQFGGRLREVVEEHDPSRIVVDGVGDLLPAARHAQRLPSYLWALAHTLRDHGASAVFTYEISSIGAADSLDALSYLFHNVIVLRYIERRGQLGRVVSILKMRHSSHAHELFDFRIGPTGFDVTGPTGDVTAMSGWTILGSGARDA